MPDCTLPALVAALASLLAPAPTTPSNTMCTPCSCGGGQDVRIGEQLETSAACSDYIAEGARRQEAYQRSLAEAQQQASELLAVCEGEHPRKTR